MKKINTFLDNTSVSKELGLHREQGFSLLELMLVLGILSSLAIMATAFVGNKNNQRHYEETRRRLELIKQVVVSNRTVNGEPELRGFVADMGRLPNDMSELLSKPADCDLITAGVQTCDWSIDSTSGLGAGWRGPYLSTQASTGGTPIFRDGWGKDWGRFSVDANEELVVQSLGRDGLANTTSTTDYLVLKNYEKDYPQTLSPATNPTDPPDALVHTSDYRIIVTDGSGVGGIPVTLRKDYSGGTCSTPAFNSDPAFNSKAKCESSGNTWTSACTILTFFSKKDCENNGGTWAFPPQFLCLRVYYRKHGIVVSKESKDSSAITIARDGSTETQVFIFDNDFTLPVGTASLQVFEYNGSATPKCTTSVIPPSTTSPVPFTVLPRTTLNPVPWTLY